jgi:hypothetical protein
LEHAAGAAQDDDDVMRALAARGVWRHSDEWWGGDENAESRFAAGEILRKLRRE